MLVAVATLTFSGGATAAAPRHIMSLSLCTDELLMDLVPPERIASVTYLSLTRSNSYLWSQARHLPINHGLAEEVLAEKPDLVLAGTYSTAAARALLKQVGAALLELGPANSFEEIRIQTRAVAHALGADTRGEELITRMDTTLRDLAATRPAATIRVAGWNGGGSVPGKGTLFDAILTAAGGVNIAATTQGVRSGAFSIEELLLAKPDVLAYGVNGNDAPGLRTDADQHPVILKLYAHRRVTYPEALFSCGMPESADAAQALRGSLLDAMRFPRGNP